MWVKAVHVQLASYIQMAGAMAKRGTYFFCGGVSLLSLRRRTLVFDAPTDFGSVLLNRVLRSYVVD